MAAPGNAASQGTSKMQPTAADVEGFISSVDTSQARGADAHELMAMMQEESGQPPVMCGPSIRRSW